MVQIGTKIVYRDEVCIVTDIAKKYKDDEDYYVFTPVYESSLLIRVPVSRASESLRPLISKKEIKSLIQKIPDTPLVSITNGWSRGSEYKELLQNGSHEGIISVIKTTYSRQQEKTEQRQKPNESDKLYFRQAERLFYREIAAALDVSYEEAKQYIISEVAALSPDNTIGQPA